MREAFPFGRVIQTDRLQQAARLILTTLFDRVLPSDCWSGVLAYGDYNDCVKWGLLETASPRGDAALDPGVGKLLFEPRARKQGRGGTALTQFESRWPLHILTGPLRVTSVHFRQHTHTSRLLLALRTESGATQHLLAGLWCCALEAFLRGSSRAPAAVASPQTRVYRNFRARTALLHGGSGVPTGRSVEIAFRGRAPLTLADGSDVENVALRCTGANVRTGLHLEIACVRVGGSDWYDFSQLAY